MVKRSYEVVRRGRPWSWTGSSRIMRTRVRKRMCGYCGKGLDGMGQTWETLDISSKQVLEWKPNMICRYFSTERDC